MAGTLAVGSAMGQEGRQIDRGATNPGPRTMPQIKKLTLEPFKTFVCDMYVVVNRHVFVQAALASRQRHLLLTHIGRASES